MHTLVFCILYLFIGVLASSNGIRADPTDLQLYQFFLNLEYLQDALLSSGLNTFSDTAFTNASFPAWTRRRFQQIAQHGTSHIQLLKSALGKSAPAPCNYTFPYNDVNSFVTLTSTLKSITVSSYIGGIQYVDSRKTLPALTAAASILSNQARHSAWIFSAVQKGGAWSSAFDSPLGLPQTYSLITPYIASCPSTNPKLPVAAFPRLSLLQSNYTAGAAVTFNYSIPYAGPTYLALYNGLDMSYFPVSANKTATLPPNLSGIVYAVLSSVATGLNSTTTLAGPLVLHFPS
ncbi:hypothetical protein FRB99_001183 [Tulasnella sp. 403]|nr:hypothetical protein FRB99_001183 [Tulasnella sp. 403]